MHIGKSVVARIDDKRLSDGPSIFYVDCEIILDSRMKSGRCTVCTKHWKFLCTMASQLPKDDDRTHPSSHTPYSALHSPQVHHENVCLKSQIS